MFQVLATKLYNCKTMVLERMDIRSNLVDHFKEGLSEMDNSMRQEDRKKSWKPEPVLEKLIRYLIKGNYGDILKFLQLLEQTGRAHILNYIIGDGGENCFFEYEDGVRFLS